MSRDFIYCLVLSTGCQKGLRTKKDPRTRASSSDITILRRSGLALAHHHSISGKVFILQSCVHLQISIPTSVEPCPGAELMEIPNDEPQAPNISEEEPPGEQARGTTERITGPRCCFEE